MIISRTPLRISFVGGGSDVRAFYQHGVGAVVSAAIDKCVYVLVNPRFDAKIRVSYSGHEMVDSVDEIRHAIIREALTLTGITQGIEVAYVSDVPLRNTGLGSSSALAVGVLNALHAYRGERVGSEQLAAEACAIEIERLGAPIGKQDQYAAACGGLNHIRFYPDERVEVRPIAIDQKTREDFERHLLLFYTGMETESHAVLEEQQSRTDVNRPMLEKLVALADEASVALVREGAASLGAMLAENWELKRRLASRISNDRIDRYYAAARSAGASGGKLLGAGGGGFLLIHCAPEKQDAVRSALTDLREVPFRFTDSGSAIVSVT